MVSFPINHHHHELQEEPHDMGIAANQVVLGLVKILMYKVVVEMDVAASDQLAFGFAIK